jgi:hypothetical protein
MLRVVEVLAGVFADGGVAAADLSAGLAQAQRNPVLPSFQAFFASLCLRMYAMSLVRMIAVYRHVFFLLIGGCRGQASCCPAG